MAQLAEQLLWTTEIRGSNPDIGKKYLKHICQLLHRKDTNKEKEAGNGQSIKNHLKITWLFEM